MARPMTLEEVERALLAAGTRAGRTSEGFRVEEIRDVTGWSVGRIRGLLRRKIADGTVRRETVTFAGIDGRTVEVPAYVFLDGSVG